MTALNWELAPEQVIIMSDSLAVSGDDHRPAFMATKVYTLPHLGLCIAGTGAQPMAARFWAHANSKCIVKDITHLNDYATDILCTIWDDLLNESENEIDGINSVTGTVYTYGCSDRETAFVGYAYRSTNGFESEPMSQGIAAKPPPKSGELPPINSLTDFLELLKEQKDEDRARPRIERLGIGGEVIMTFLKRDEEGFTVIEQRPLFRFDDFDSDWDIILSKLPANRSHPHSIATLVNDP